MDSAELLETARAALNAGWLEVVDNLCDLGLAQNAADADLMVLKGHAADKRNDYAAAVQWLEKALEASGGKIRIAVELLPALHKSGNDAAALDLARKLAGAISAEDHPDTRLGIARFVIDRLGNQHAGAELLLTDAAYRALLPIRLRLESASACNLRCQHCPTGVHYDATERSIMKPDLFERVLAQMKDVPTLKECVLYLGGEPLMNKRLVDMCQRVKSETSVLRTFITTNGMLLNERNCAALATANLDQIFVSVDGRSPEENDEIRVRAKYATIVENVARLRRHLDGTKTVVVISHAMIRRTGDPDACKTPDFLRRDFPGLYIWSDYATRWPGFDLEHTELSSATLSVGKQTNFCGFPFAEMSVRVNGDVVLCCHDLLGESVMGNVWKSDLAAIWNGPAYRTMRKHMLARDAKGVHDVCRRCFVFTGERIERSAMLESESVA